MLLLSWRSWQTSIEYVRWIRFLKLYDTYVLRNSVTRPGERKSTQKNLDQTMCVACSVTAIRSATCAVAGKSTSFLPISKQRNVDVLTTYSFSSSLSRVVTVLGKLGFIRGYSYIGWISGRNKRMGVYFQLDSVFIVYSEPSCSDTHRFLTFRTSILYATKSQQFFKHIIRSRKLCCLPGTLELSKSFLLPSAFVIISQRI